MDQNRFALLVGLDDGGNGMGVVLRVAGAVTAEDEVEPGNAKLRGNLSFRQCVCGVVLGEIDDQPDVIVQQSSADEKPRQLGVSIDPARFNRCKIIGKKPPLHRSRPGKDPLDEKSEADHNGGNPRGAVALQCTSVVSGNGNWLQDLQEKRLLPEQFEWG